MKITRNINQEYRTSDLACASALSLFVSVLDLDKSDPRRAQFIFKRTEELDELIEQFRMQELSVEPRAYFDQIKALKTRLYETY
jgi:hypothetical protein